MLVGNDGIYQKVMILHWLLHNLPHGHNASHAPSLEEGFGNSVHVGGVYQDLGAANQIVDVHKTSS